MARPEFILIGITELILTAATFRYLIYFQSLHNGASANMFYQKSILMLMMMMMMICISSQKIISYCLVMKRGYYTSNLELKH